MTPYWTSPDGRHVLYCGDCIEVMATLDAESVDAIVCDPPYGLSFMGKKWDYDVPSEDIWRECLRVLKPGGHLLAFAGTRTQHRMAVRIEDAGFEIRDMIAWVYGSGFPKSLDVSKAIDKVGGKQPPVGFAEWLCSERNKRGLTSKELCERGGFYKNVNHGGLVSNWEAGIGFPNAEQFNLLCDLLELPFERREVVIREILGWRQVMPGVAFSSDGLYELPITAPATEAARQWSGWGTALKPALEPITVARKPLVGTVAANVLEHGTGAINVDGCRVGTEQWTRKGGDRSTPYGNDRTWSTSGTPDIDRTSTGRWPANLIHDGSDEVVGLFPQTVGKIGMVGNTGGNNRIYGKFGRQEDRQPGTTDSGSAARFFYCAKASKADRDEGCEGLIVKDVHRYGAGIGEGIDPNAPAKNRNYHPTVKPTDLMRYLCRLVTPPGGIVLDPFCGSGSTGKAAILEGFQFIGIELSREYCDIAVKRMERELSQPHLPGLEPHKVVQGTMFKS